MEAKRYVEAYPLDIKPEVLHAGDWSEPIIDAQAWSYKFGRQLHADLAGTAGDSPEHPVEDREYWRWMGLMISNLN